MPAVLPEASVVRSPSHAQAAGGRSQTGGEQAASLFSDLLDTCERTEASAPDLANIPADQTSSEAAPLEPKVAPPGDVPKASNAAEAATAQAELMLAMVTGLQAAPEDKKLSPLPAANVAVSVPVPDEAQPKNGADTPPAQADASDAAEVLAVVQPAAQPVPLPPAVPVPSPVPAVVETIAAAPVPSPVPAVVETVAAAPVTEAVPAAAPVAVEAKAAASVSPAVDTAAPKAAQPVVAAKQATETAPALAGQPTEPASTPARQTTEMAPAPARQTTEMAPPPAKQATETAPAPAARVAEGEKPAAAKAEITSDAETSPTAKAPSPEQAAPASKPAVAEAAVAVEKPANRPAQVVANGAQRDAEAPDAKPAAGIAPASTEMVANLGALSAPPAHTAPAGPQAAHPSAQQPASTETVPAAGLAVEIAAQARNGNNRFEIRLDPPELGRIDVRLDVDKDGQVTSHLRVERAETLDLLRRDAPALERALQQAGLKTSDSGLQFSLRDQAFSHREQGRDMPAAARIVVSDDILIPVETQRNYGRLAGLGGGVDIRV